MHYSSGHLNAQLSPDSELQQFLLKCAVFSDEARRVLRIKTADCV